MKYYLSRISTFLYPHSETNQSISGSLSMGVSLRIFLSTCFHLVELCLSSFRFIGSAIPMYCSIIWSSHFIFHWPSYLMNSDCYNFVLYMWTCSFLCLSFFLFSFFLCSFFFFKFSIKLIWSIIFLKKQTFLIQPFLWQKKHRR